LPDLEVKLAGIGADVERVTTDEPGTEVRDLTVAYGAIQAVRGVSFSVEQGQIVSLIGSNGAGKTTTLRTISGLLRPVSGEILFDGQPREALPRPLITNSLAFVDQDVFLFAHGASLVAAHASAAQPARNASPPNGVIIPSARVPVKGLGHGRV